MASEHYINLEQLGWPGPNFDAILAEVERHEDDPTAYLCKNLREVTSAARRGVIILLGKLGDRRCLSTLMRFVFDTPGQVLEQDARAAAMKAIIDITDAQDEDAPDRRRVADFLMQMVGEPDGFVRGLVMRGLGRFGSRRALYVLKDAWEDTHQFVADEARAAHRALSDRAHLLPELEKDRPHRDLEDAVLLDRIRFVNISEMKLFLRELTHRPNALELAERFLNSGDQRNHYMLEVLPDLNNPAGREVVAKHLEMASDEVDLAASLNLLAYYLDGDVSPDECQSIESGLRHTSPHIQRAAIHAAGQAGDAYLLKGVIVALSSRDLETVLAAAMAVEGAVARSDDRWVQPLLGALSRVHPRRLKYEFPRDIQSEALILRALARSASSDGDRALINQAFESLSQVHQYPEILAAALRLLHEITPVDGLPEDTRWTRGQAHTLILLIPYSDAGIRRQLVDLLSRGAPEHFGRGVNILGELGRRAEDAMRAQIIGLLERSGHRDADAFLEELAPVQGGEENTVEDEVEDENTNEDRDDKE